MKRRPYIFWSKNELFDQLIKTEKELKLPLVFHDLIQEAVYSDDWDSINEYDGCTLVQDKYHPSIACFIHDYLWRTGRGGKDADRLFRWLLIKEGVVKLKAQLFYLIVRSSWYLYFNFKHRNNRKENSPIIKKVYKKIL